MRVTQEIKKHLMKEEVTNIQVLPFKQNMLKELGWITQKAQSLQGGGEIMVIYG